MKKRFIEEANRIRTRYLSAIERLIKKEDSIKVHKERINNILLDVKKYIDENKSSDIDVTEELKNELLEIETAMGYIQNDVKILIDKVEKLQKETNTLYINIKETHPEMSDKQIQKEILYSLKK